MKHAAVLIALVLAACGGGKTPAPAAPQQPVTEATSPDQVPAAPNQEAAPQKPEQPELEPWQTQPVMPPSGHWLWSVPPDQSPLWQLVEPDN